ncbi:hypothetical protein EV643_116201 [Kribbella sp. VKM Ac-2527]|uniref:DUF11 domain-containing protein n=1 Tax=Kribbella caucasensis TaxID=2512215 RepID=A0A4R6K558_9ACTN|nr:hypothetical protein [Kribbella sp. VKM Ac-2527]TDO44389.1 hypothetical protein EV643_116201 [Kribbella sp. VKM Ac-2527]
MTRYYGTVVAALATLAAVALPGPTPSPGAPGAQGWAIVAGPAQVAAVDVVTVELDKTQAAIGLGQNMKFISTVRNPGEQEVSGAIAHLNVLAVDAGVYVDPEDWSGERTQYLDPIGGGEEETLEWEIQAVNSGRFIVYVAITSSEAAGAVIASKSLRLDVAAERTLDASGLVPIAAGVPGLLVLLMGLVMVRRRRHRPKNGPADNG